MDRLTRLRLGNFLRQKRIEAHLTQQQLAAKTGISRVSISNYENGLQRPFHENLANLCRGMGYLGIVNLGGGLKFEITPAGHQEDLARHPPEQLNLPFNVVQRFQAACIRVTKRNGKMIIRAEFEEAV